MDRQTCYQSPRLTRFGRLRDLTQQSMGKTVIGDDLVPGIGMDCNPDPSSGVNACTDRS